MALKWKGRARETSTTTGTGDITLAGAVTSYGTFAALMSTGDTAYVTMAHRTTYEFIDFLATMQADGTLARTTVIDGSSGVGTNVSFSSGTKDVFLTLPPAIVETVLGASLVTLGSTAYATSERVLTAGTGISLVDGGAGSTITISSTVSGTVTSVAMTVPSVLSVSGSPVTSSGTFAVTLATQNANIVFAGPTSGGAATPAFRTLVSADIPDLSGTYAAASHTHAHSALTGLTSGDDHTQYALLAGRSGGQTVDGGTAASEKLILNSTAHATKGLIQFGDDTYKACFDEANGKLIVGALATDASQSGGTPALLTAYGARNTTSVRLHTSETGTNISSALEFGNSNGGNFVQMCKVQALDNAFIFTNVLGEYISLRNLGGTGSNISSFDLNEDYTYESVRVTTTAAPATLATKYLNCYSSGTPTDGFGAKMIWRLETSTTTDIDAAQITVVWTTATHASRTSSLSLSAYYTSTAQEILTLTAVSTGVSDSKAVFSGRPSASFGSGNRNQRFGDLSGKSSATGADNVLFGYNTGNALTSGYNNSFLGSQAGKSVQGGRDNCFVGALCGYSATSAVRNGGMGQSALYSLTDGTDNYAMGDEALKDVVGGDGNIGIGSQAGRGAASGAVTLTTGTYNTVIGYQAGVEVNSQANGIALGRNAVCADAEFALSPYITAQTFYGLSSTSTRRAQGKITNTWGVSTDASREGILSLYGVDYNGDRLGFQVTGNGSATEIGFYGVTPVAKQSGDVATGLVNLGLFSAADYTSAIDLCVILAPTTDARNVIQPTASTVKALVLKGASSQSDNLFEAQSSAAAVGAKITSAMEYSNNGPATGSATNEIFGNGAGRALASGAQYNTAMGNNALYTATSGDGNVAIGYTAGYTANGLYNIYCGFEAGYASTSDYNVYIGYQARHSSSASDSYSVSIGAESRSAGSGVSIGYQAHASDSKGISIGRASNGGADSIGIGYIALAGNNSIVIGYAQQSTPGGNQVLIGRELTSDGVGSYSFGYKSTDTYLAWMRDTSGVGSGTAVFQMRMTPTWVVSTYGSHLSKFTLGVNDNTTERIGITLTAVTGGCTTTLSSPLLGTNVANVTTTATNDDPNYQIRQNRVATTDATVTTLETIAITASKTYLLESRVVARRTGGASGTADDGAVYIRRAMVTTKAGTVTINAVQDELTQEDQAGWDCTFTVSGTNILLRITGAADNAVTWHSTTIVQDLGT